MKKNIIINILLFLMCVPSIFISFKVYESFKIQKGLIYEWGLSELIIPFEVVQKIDHNFPNITTTALPMATVKAKYYIKEGLMDSALILFDEGVKQNPYLGVSVNLKSQFYLNKKMIDSAYINAKKSFERLPNNIHHSETYFTSLAAKGMFGEMIKAFESIKIKETEVWDSFLRLLKFDIDNHKETYTKYLDSTIVLYPKNASYRKLKIEEEVGMDNVNLSVALETKANEMFEQENLKGAAEFYNSSINKNPFNYISLENYGITLFKLDSFEKASKMFKRKTLDLQDKGISEFYLGIIYSQKNKDSSCYYFERSFKKKYLQSEVYLKNYCFK